MNPKKSHKNPPRIAQWLLGHILPDEKWNTPLGDFEEFYNYELKEKGFFRAWLWYWGQIFKLLPKNISNSIYWRFMMFLNYVKITIRNLRKNKGHSFISIFGLAIGLACCLLVFLWMQDEFQFDHFHQNKDNIVQVYSETFYDEGPSNIFTGSYYPLANIIKTEVPEVLDAIRYQAVASISAKYKEKRFITNIAFTDTSFFQIFSYSFLNGNSETALSEKSSIIISEEMSKKLFANEEDPVGKTLRLDNQIDLVVTGVIKNVPFHSSLQFDCVVPYVWLFGGGQEPTHWGGNPFQTYALLHENANFKEVSQKITTTVEKHEKNKNQQTKFYLHPFTKAHLYSPHGGGLIQSIITFSIIVFFVLIIACINFMNLNTARFATRSNEVGLRKVVGARRSNLIGQFLGESILLTLLSFVSALFIVWLILPTFNSLMGKQLSVNMMVQPTVIIGFLAISFFTGIVSGSYPALFLSSLQPIHAIREIRRFSTKSTIFRKSLVVIQFSISIILIIASTVITKQTHFIKTKDLGFDPKNVLCVNTTRTLQNQYETVKIELLRNPNIVSVSRSMQHPGNIGSSVSALDWDGKNPEESTSMNFEFVDYDYLKTMGMEILNGRSFSREHPTDLEEGYVVNEEAVKLMGMDSPVGERLSVFKKEGRIIGVVKNYHFQPLHYPIQPFVIGANQNWGRDWMFIKYKKDNLAEALAYTDQVFKQFDPNSPAEPTTMERHFFDEALDFSYKAEKQISQFASYFTILAILISCLGLFGLASFMAQQRTKEIGIRKVLGASVPKVVLMLSKDFTKWVILSNLFAWPIAYWITQKILEKFAYRTNVGIEIFILAGLLALLIALLTVSYHAIHTAQTNPVDSLKYE